jgi:hypothetical protein
MVEIRKNPFKPNVIENDPSAFGLRSKEIISSIESLFNDNSIFITGSRGIGKSSLGLQLQKILNGDNTLLQRCNISRQLNGTLCIYYACANDTSIEELCLDILYEIEQELMLLPELKLNKIKPTLELNFGVLKAKFEGEIESRKRSPSSIATRFVNGIRIIYEKAVELGICSGINIMIDEVDQLPESINFGHFVKIIHETLSNRSCNKVTFTFAGQLGSYTRFNNEDPSFERIVKCIPLDKLSWDASEHILDYATTNANPRFSFEYSAKNLILAIASGFPYVIHLMGDGCYRELINSNIVTRSIVLTSLADILLTDKREKFTDKLKCLTDNEQKLLFKLSSLEINSLPAELYYSSIVDIIPDKLIEEVKIDSILNTLTSKGVLYSKNDGSIFMFSDELFRIFISYMKIEMANSKATRREFDSKQENKDLLSERSLLDKGIQDLVAMGDFDENKIAQLSDEEKMKLYNEFISPSIPFTATNGWEEDKSIFED